MLWLALVYTVLNVMSLEFQRCCIHEERRLECFEKCLSWFKPGFLLGRVKARCWRP